MSEPRYTTDNTRETTCAKCGQSIVEKETLGMYGSGPLWSKERHTAPCGAECWGAAVSGKAYREKQLHGFKEYPCPKCKEAT